MKRARFLIVGLGNPAPFSQTRHSAGRLFVENLCKKLKIPLRHESGGIRGFIANPLGGKHGAGEAENECVAIFKKNQKKNQDNRVRIKKKKKKKVIKKRRLAR
jgi:hypothetical protein